MSTMASTTLIQTWETLLYGSPPPATDCRLALARNHDGGICVEEQLTASLCGDMWRVMHLPAEPGSCGNKCCTWAPDDCPWLPS